MSGDWEGVDEAEVREGEREGWGVRVNRRFCRKILEVAEGEGLETWYEQSSRQSDARHPGAKKERT